MICVNCGTNRNLKVYYIVPLINGGNDIDSNKVCLCSKCSKLANLSDTKKNGRPSFGNAEDFEDTLKDWFECRIGTKEAKALIGLKQSNQSTWSRLKKEYKEKHNIVDNRNNIDILEAKGLDNNLLGYIKYKDEEKYIFRKI